MITLREQFEKEIGKSSTEDYIKWLEAKIEDIDEDLSCEIEQQYLTLDDTEEIQSLITFCKDLPCVGYVFTWHKHINDDVIEVINEHQTHFTLARYAAGSYLVKKVC